MIAHATPPSRQRSSNGSVRQQHSFGSKPNTPPQANAPLIKLDRSSQSPPHPFVVELMSRQQGKRRYSTNCLPIPTSSSDRVHELPLVNTRMPLARCPSCSTVSTDTALEPHTIKRIHDICGIMPSDFLQNVSTCLMATSVLFCISEEQVSRWKPSNVYDVWLWKLCQHGPFFPQTHST